MTDPKPFQVLLEFDKEFADVAVNDRELQLVSTYLPELLKEMIWHMSQEKD